jgi:hypothetical protein
MESKQAYSFEYFEEFDGGLPAGDRGPERAIPQPMVGPSRPLSGNAHLAGLRRASDLAREAERGRQEHPIPIRIAALDRLLGGGIRRGRLTEIFAPRPAGRFAAGLSTLAAATQTGESAALVDLADHLDPQIAETAGVDLRRLLWIRPKTLKQAACAAEMALAAGFALVVLDLGLPPLRGKLSTAFWVRLARAAETSRGALLLLAPYHLAGSVADVSVRLFSARPVWQGKGLEPRLLTGLSSFAILEKRRGGRPGEAGAFCLHVA